MSSKARPAFFEEGVGPLIKGLYNEGPEVLTAEKRTTALPRKPSDRLKYATAFV